jgi:ADP-heptose:LPS heptosyltransferase
MVGNRLSENLFRLTSALTTWSPKAGARFLDAVLSHTVGSRPVANHFFRRNLAIVRGVAHFDRILVIADIHIGDAVMLQGAITAFRDFFPTARIDYIIKQSAACLIEGNSDISNLYPIFTGTVYPDPSDPLKVSQISRDNRYDLCLDCSPFLEDRRVFAKGQSVLNFLTVAPQLVRNEFGRTGINHFSYQSREFVHTLLSTIRRPVRTEVFAGVPVTISDRANEEAEAFLRDSGIQKDRAIIFLNPDAASMYTRIPFEYQVAILTGLTQFDAQILLGAGFTERQIEQRLLSALPPAQRARIACVPKSLSLDAYAALCDFMDVFVSADTGPLHIAAARKVSRSGNHRFRNRTFVISLFGATPAHMSGYDSSDPLYPAANQDAPSRTYVSGSPCRNLTCVNKIAKTCKVARCFETLDVAQIVADIKSYLPRLDHRRPESCSTALVAPRQESAESIVSPGGASVVSNLRAS